MKNKYKKPDQVFEQFWKQKFEKFAEKYDDDASIAGWSRSGLSARLSRFSRYWEKFHYKDEKRLWLDAGCGAGTYSRLLSSKGHDVVGIDYSFQSIKKAKTKSQSSITWVVADIKRLPFRSNIYDGVICFGVVQAVSDSDVLITEIKRCTSSNGEIWVDALNKWFIPNIFKNISSKLAKRNAINVRYESHFKLKRILRRNGYDSISVFWVPVVPETSFMFRPINSRIVEIFFRYIPGLAMLTCHSVLIRASSKEN